MPTNTNQGSIPTSADPEAIRTADVEGFVTTLSTWARALPRKEQALLHLMLAAAASARSPDVGAYLAGFPIPNPGDVVVAATGTSSGVQSDAVVGPSAGAVEGNLSEGQMAGAAGGALARALLNNWGETGPLRPARGRGSSSS
jgi:hypothetical protein